MRVVSLLCWTFCLTPWHSFFQLAFPRGGGEAGSPAQLVFFLPTPLPKYWCCVKFSPQGNIHILQPDGCRKAGISISFLTISSFGLLVTSHGLMLFFSLLIFIPIWLRFYTFPQTCHLHCCSAFPLFTYTPLHLGHYWVQEVNVLFSPSVKRGSKS